MMGGIDPDDFVMPEHVTWESADGFEVHGLLYTPRTVVAGQHRLPGEHPRRADESVAFRLESALIQYLVQRGWVVIQPNYRGSLGYGRAYREALFASWGDGRSAGQPRCGRTLRAARADPAPIGWSPGAGAPAATRRWSA